jgi:hypothetical protein
VTVRSFSLILAACAVALATAAAAPAAPRFGVAEDVTKYADDGGASIYPRIKALGMVENRFTVRWNPADPTAIQEQGFLDRSLPAAARAGIRIVFDVYPMDEFAFSSSPESHAGLFAAYLQTLARHYPQVNDFIVGNEPNESYFWQPQFGPAGEVVSAAAFLKVMSAAYDALKAVRPDIRVIASGPSNEGNDKTSSSPVRFLKALGDAYRASGRIGPFMDALGFHVYPRVNTNPPSKEFSWPNAGAADLARLKQAVWDAFAGTGQPTFPEGLQPAGGGALGIVVDEFGWQVEIGPGLASGYKGAENVPTISEAEQATYYAELAGMLACDPAVTDAMVFHLIDEVDLGRFQTGLLRIDGSERPSYDSMRAAIVAAPSCSPVTGWDHTTSVVGAQAVFGTRNQPARRAVFGISATAAEDAVAKAGIFPVPGSKAKPKTRDIERSLASPGGVTKPVLTVLEEVKAGYTPRMEFRGRLAPGHYVFAVRLTSTMNPSRSQILISKPFKVG